MAKEGIEVIRANNRRVATAKKATALTAKNLQAAKKAGDKAVESAQKTIESATKDHDETTKELKDAEKSQEAAQKKWEVVDLVEEDEEKQNSSSGSKKRAGASSDSEIDSNKKIRSISDIPNEIIVSGCGLVEVNGTYKRDVNIWSHARSYSKEGQWKGKDITNANDSPAPPSNGWEVTKIGVEPPPEISWE
eukprot:scaffold199301_cov33-Cyclotella_meneghiniana.AAC.2